MPQLLPYSDETLFTLLAYSRQLTNETNERCPLLWADRRDPVDEAIAEALE